MLKFSSSFADAFPLSILGGGNPSDDAPEPAPIWSTDHMRKVSQYLGRLNSRIALELPALVEEFFPDTYVEQDRLIAGPFTIFLSPCITMEHPHGTVARGAWLNRLTGENGGTYQEFYSRMRWHSLDYATINEILAAKFDIEFDELPSLGPNEAKLKREREPISCCMWTAPTTGRIRYYNAKTRQPIVAAMEDWANGGFCIRYFERLKIGRFGQMWVESQPGQALPWYNREKFSRNTGKALRVVQTELDPRLEQSSPDWDYTTVPNGVRNVRYADFKSVRGRRMHLELLTADLSVAEEIYDSLKAAPIGWVTFSLIDAGDGKTRSLDELEQVAESFGHKFTKPKTPKFHINRAMRRAGAKIAGKLIHREDILAPFLKERGLCWFFGAPGIGKSYSLMYFAYLMSRGGSLGSVKSAGGKRVFYLDGEMEETDYENALVRICRGTEDTSEEAPFSYRCAKGELEGVINLLEPIWQERLLDDLRQEKSEVLILDNFYSLTNNHPSEFPEILKFLQKIRAMGVAIIVSDHCNSEGKLQGSATKERAAETVVEVRRPEKARLGDGLISFEVTKARAGITEKESYLVARMNFDDDAFKMELVDDESELATEEVVSDETAQLALVVYLRDKQKLSFPKIQDQYGIPRSTAGDRYKKAKSLKGEERFALERALQKLVGEQKEGE